MSFETELRSHYAGVKRRLTYGGVTLHSQDTEIRELEQRLSDLRGKKIALQQEKSALLVRNRELLELVGKLQSTSDQQVRRIAMLEYQAGVPTKEEEGRIPSLRGIIQQTARSYDMKVRELLSHRRTPRIVTPRQVAMYLCKTLTLCSLPMIGRHFDGRDHTTVLHSVQKISGERLADPELDKRITEIECAISASLIAAA